MKIKSAIISVILLTSTLLNAQVLLNDNFNNYTIGNLGTDYTGVTPGKGGWLTISEFFGKNSHNNCTTITNELGKGKVLTLSSEVPPHDLIRLDLTKPDLNSLIDQRNIGSNVIRLEFDFYTGPQTIGSSGDNTFQLNYHNNQSYSNALVSYRYKSDTGNILVERLNGTFPVSLDNNNTTILPFNTWVTFIVYLDYNNKKIYFETPYFNTVAVGDFLVNSTSTNLIEDFKPQTIRNYFHAPKTAGPQQMVNKLDNIKLTALKSVPPYVLSANTVLAEKFNLYPNPATNVVNITNNENMLVKQIAVYDVAGKLITTENYNNEVKIQLNIESLAIGSYMLHLQTNEGKVVKKLVKK